MNTQIITDVPSAEMVSTRFSELTQFLIQNQLSVSTMESCTGGMIASLITDTPRSSEVFPGGFVTYSNAGKIMQGVLSDTIETHGVYSRETALEMGRCCRDSYHTEIGIGVTGTFERADPQNNDSIPGEVWFSVILESQEYTGHIKLTPHISRFESKLETALAIANACFSVLTSLY